MPITTVSTIACDDCKKVLELGSDFFYMNVSVSGTTPPPFSDMIVFCDAACFKSFAAALTVPTETTPTAS